MTSLTIESWSQLERNGWLLDTCLSALVLSECPDSLLPAGDHVPEQMCQCLKMCVFQDEEDDGGTDVPVFEDVCVPR